MTEQIRIEKITEHGERIRLRLTGLEKPLVVEQAVVHEHRLVEGIVLTESQFTILREAAGKLACGDSAGRMLAIRGHSIGELKAKLSKKGFQVESISQAVRKYKALGFLDDALYARERVESMLRKNPAGRSHLIGMLRKKMVGRTLSEQIVNSVLAGHDETELAVRSLTKRWGMIRDLELERARTKAYNYLSRRGISFGTAKAAFEQLYKEEQEEREELENKNQEADY